MLQRTRELLESAVGTVNVIAAPGKYAGLGIETIADCWPGEGPLGGIITALRYTEADATHDDWNLIVGCDMPFLTREWIAYLADRAMSSQAQVLLPRSQHGLEPLCACYKTEVRAQLQAGFESGERKVTRALEVLKREVVEESEWKPLDPSGRLFWNMNTSADYDEARRILKTEHT